MLGGKRGERNHGGESALLHGVVASERDLRESGCEVWLSWRKEPRVEKHCVSRPAVWSVLDVAMDSKEPGERGGDRGKLRGWSKSGV